MYEEGGAVKGQLPGQSQSLYDIFISLGLAAYQPIYKSPYSYIYLERRVYDHVYILVSINGCKSTKEAAEKDRESDVTLTEYRAGRSKQAHGHPNKASFFLSFVSLTHALAPQGGESSEGEKGKE